MEQVTLRARTGRTPGSREARRIRRTGQIPAVVYGHGLDPMAISVDSRELFGALHTELGINALINLQLDGQELLTLARVVDRHPYRDEYQHVDFVQVLLTERVDTEVAIHFIGEPVGVEEQGGVFSPARTSVHLEAVVTNIPGFIELDISGVAIGESLRVEDLAILEGVTYLDDPETVIVSVTVPAAEEEEEPDEEEAAEGEEPAEGEAAEGAEADDETG